MRNEQRRLTESLGRRGSWSSPAILSCIVCAELFGEEREQSCVRVTVACYAWSSFTCLFFYTCSFCCLFLCFVTEVVLGGEPKKQKNTHRQIKSP